MSTFHDQPTSPDGPCQTDDWVVESCLLDLIPDEEQPDDLDDWARRMGWSTLLATARTRLTDVPKNGDTCWPGTALPAFLDSTDASRVADWFLNMKAARARASLDCDRARFDYASDPSDSNREFVRQQLRIIRNTLDAINLDSLAGFGTLLRNLQSLPPQWGILAGLLHSEVCASGTTADVSYGMARAFESFFRSSEGQHPGPWRWLFQLLSSHNQARGWSHQGNHLECIRLLEPILETFNSDIPASYLALAERLVFFPAVFTLADSLQDCHRTAEAAWWLTRARDTRSPSLYWRARLDVELSSLSGPPLAPPARNDWTRPKLMNYEQHLRYVRCQQQIADLRTRVDVARCATEWAAALKWTVTWHEDDHLGLLGTIRGVAKSVGTITAALELRFADKNDADGRVADRRPVLDAVVSVLDHLARTITRIKDPVFRFLSPEKDVGDMGLTSRTAVVNVWTSVKSLLPALKAAIKLHESTVQSQPNVSSPEVPSSLETWLQALQQRLNRARAAFADVAAKQSMWELLNNPEQLCKNALDQRRRTPCACASTCREWNCVETTLRFPETERRPKVASADYLLRRMARTDAEFARFLGSRSLEQSQNGTTVTPPFEFISLRRWNSFSPNLASRATTTVGGGYLVRVRNESTDKYVGIAIDPGYNYLENLFDEGFTLPDVDVVVVTHAHPDHVENLSNILTLLRERNKRTDGPSRIHLVLTEGVFLRFKSLIDNEIDFIQDVVVLSWSRSNRSIVHVLGLPDRKPVSLTMGEPPQRPLMSIQAVQAIHNDGTTFDSMGVILRVARGFNERPFGIGFTGDTRYSKDLCATAGFGRCDVLVPHLGSMLSNEAFEHAHESWKVGGHEERLKKAIGQLTWILTRKNHLCLPGVAMLLCDLAGDANGAHPLVVLSEFGEELRGGLRADLATRLQRVFDITVLPADVGLRVGVEERSVRCAVCRQYVPAGHIHPVAVSDEDEALMFVCDDCYVARQHELAALLASLRKAPYELHIEPREPASPISTRSDESRLAVIASGSDSGEGRPDANLQPPRQS